MDCLKEFESDDILYHYTKTTTALEHILFKKVLRLSDRVNSNDPIENMTPSTWIRMNGCDNRALDKIDTVYRDVKDKISRLKQVCFCMNDTSNRFENMLDKPYEFYGCMKPRMWEQYADNYNGVCLVLSKAELLKPLNNSYKYNAINYVVYNDLIEKVSKINAIELCDSNYDKYLRKIFDKIDKYIFHKHEDYKGENEYRICSYEAIEINIESTLKGIIVSDKNSEYFNKELLKYVTTNVDVLQIKWKSSGVEINSLRNLIECKKINKRIDAGLKNRNKDKE